MCHIQDFKKKPRGTAHFMYARLSKFVLESRDAIIKHQLVDLYMKKQDKNIKHRAHPCMLQLYGD
jgi:hypothetical protein